MPSREALLSAKSRLEAMFLDPKSSTQLHSVGIGYIQKDGVDTGEVGVIVTVARKATAAELPPSEFVPSAIQVDTQDPNTPPTETVKVDVQVAPQPTPEIAYLDSPEFETVLYSADPQAGNIAEWRRCFNYPMPGGPQIAPRGARFVGTLGAAVRHRDGFGALTNFHVASLNERIGQEMCQPDGSSSRSFAKVIALSKFVYGAGGANRCDVAILDTLVDGGHTVVPEQFKIGRINPNFVPRTSQKLGDRVQKSGRTTGHMWGKVVQTDLTTYVGYDRGDARFVNQLAIRGEGGLFSNGGDSGSLVVTDDVRPYGLLFAGGGDITIISPIQFVVEDFQITFF